MTSYFICRSCGKPANFLVAGKCQVCRLKEDLKNV